MRPPLLKLPARRPELRGSVEPAANPVFSVVSEAGTAVITIFAEIGGPTGVTAERINAALAEIPRQPVILKINSYGGDSFEGVAIFNLLRQHGGQVTAQVLGIAASAASIIAMAADRIEMAKNSKMMIHQSWTLAVGNADLFEEVAAFLRKVDLALTGTYAARTGLDQAQVAKMMAVETTMSADEAIDMGFADALLEADAAPALRSRADTSPQSRRDLESRLRDTGLSKSAAAKVVAGGWSALDRSSDDPERIHSLISTINTATSNLRKAIKP